MSFLNIYEDKTAVLTMNSAKDSRDIFDHRIKNEGGQVDISFNSDETAFTIPYRLISQSILFKHGFWGMSVIDYSKPGVLKRSTKMTEGLTIIQDHMMDSGNWLGKVLESKWGKTINDIDLPGINAVCQFAVAEDDIERNWIQRGIREGYLQGMSVSAWIEWEQSHPELDWYDFVTQMGQEVEGSVVRMIVTEVKRYYETSICIAGVDPDATPSVEENALNIENKGELLASLSAAAGWSFREKSPQVIVNKEDKNMADVKNEGQGTNASLNPEHDETVIELAAQKARNDELELRQKESDAKIAELQKGRDISEVKEFMMGLGSKVVKDSDGIVYNVSASFQEAIEPLISGTPRGAVMELAEGAKPARSVLMAVVEKVIELAGQGGLLVPMKEMAPANHTPPEGSDNGSDYDKAIELQKAEGIDYNAALLKVKEGK